MSLLLPAGGATVTAAPVTISFAAATYDSVNRTEYTFSSHAIGTAAADRQVVVATTTIGGGGGTEGVGTLTIGGSSAALVKAGTVGGDHTQTELWKLAVASGTTADIVVTWQRSCSNSSVAVWAVYGASTTISATAGDTTDPDPTTTIAVPADGGVIAAYSSEPNTGTAVAMTGVTEDYDTIPETSFMIAGGNDDQLAAETRTILFNINGTIWNGGTSLVVASFAVA